MSKISLPQAPPGLTLEVDKKKYFAELERGLLCLYKESNKKDLSFFINLSLVKFERLENKAGFQLTLLTLPKNKDKGIWKFASSLEQMEEFTNAVENTVIYASPKLFDIPLKISFEKSCENVPYPLAISYRQLLLTPKVFDQVGIFRKSPRAEDKRIISDRMDSFYHFNFTESECDTPDLAASIFKDFLYRLPEPIIPLRTLDAWQALGSDNLQGRIEEAKRVITSLDRAELVTLKFVIHTLVKVVKHSKNNLMDTANVGIVFGPSLILPRDCNDFTSSCNDFVEFMVCNYKALFSMISKEEIDKLKLPKRRSLPGAPSENAKPSCIMQKEHSEKTKEKEKGKDREKELEKELEKEREKAKELEKELEKERGKESESEKKHRIKNSTSGDLSSQPRTEPSDKNLAAGDGLRKSHRSNTISSHHALKASLVELPRPIKVSGSQSSTRSAQSMRSGDSSVSKDSQMHEHHEHHEHRGRLTRRERTSIGLITTPKSSDLRSSMKENASADISLSAESKRKHKKNSDIGSSLSSSGKPSKAGASMTVDLLGGMPSDSQRVRPKSVQTEHSLGEPKSQGSKSHDHGETPLQGHHPRPSQSGGELQMPLGTPPQSGHLAPPPPLKPLGGGAGLSPKLPGSPPVLPPSSAQAHATGLPPLARPGSSCHAAPLHASPLLAARGVPPPPPVAQGSQSAQHHVAPPPGSPPRGASSLLPPPRQPSPTQMPVLPPVVQTNGTASPTQMPALPVIQSNGTASPTQMPVLPPVVQTNRTPPLTLSQQTGSTKAKSESRQVALGAAQLAPNRPASSAASSKLRSPLSPPENVKEPQRSVPAQMHAKPLPQSPPKNGAMSPPPALQGPPRSVNSVPQSPKMVGTSASNTPTKAVPPAGVGAAFPRNPVRTPEKPLKPINRAVAAGHQQQQDVNVKGSPSLTGTPRQSAAPVKPPKPVKPARPASFHPSTSPAISTPPNGSSEPKNMNAAPNRPGMTPKKPEKLVSSVHSADAKPQL